MASQDGQPDCISCKDARSPPWRRICRSRRLVRPPVVLWRRRLVRPPAGGALEAAAAPPETGEHTRCVCCGLLAAAPQAGACQSCRTVDKQRQRHGLSWPAKWETVEAASKERFQRRTTRSSRGGPFLLMEVWLRRGFTEEQVRKGDYEEHPQLGPTYQLEIHDQGPAASPALRAEAGGPAAKCLPRAKPPPSGPAAKHPPNPASHPSCRRRSRRCPARRPAALPLPTCFLRCVPPAALPLPSRLVLGLLRPAALPLPAGLVRPAVLPLLPSHARRVSNCSEPTLLRVRAGGDFL